VGWEKKCSATETGGVKGVSLLASCGQVLFERRCNVGITTFSAARSWFKVHSVKAETVTSCIYHILKMEYVFE
jgi:hypothetical protein